MPCPGPRSSQPGLQSDRRTGGLTSCACASDPEVQGFQAGRWERTQSKTGIYHARGGLGGTQQSPARPRGGQRHGGTGTGECSLTWWDVPPAPRAGVVPPSAGAGHQPHLFCGSQPPPPGALRDLTKSSLPNGTDALGPGGERGLGSGPGSPSLCFPSPFLRSADVKWTVIINTRCPDGRW